MRRKKKGSSLIYVIIIFMFVTTVSTAMISMISANYRARVTENKRIENLYGSDSGIDVAYNIMGKTFDAATRYGYYRIKTLTDTTITGEDKSVKCTYALQYKNLNSDINDLNGKISKLKLENNSKDITKETIQANNRKIDTYKQLIEDDENYIEVLLNEEFKSGFKAFFDDSDNKLNEDFKLKNCVESQPKQYVYQVNGLNSDNIQVTTLQYEADRDVNKQAILNVDISNPYNTSGNDIPNYGIEPSEDGHTQIAKFTKTTNKAYNIKITSHFKSKNDTNIIGNNDRAVEANYVIKIPNYDDVFFGKGISNQKYLALEDRSLTVGSDMNIENVENLTVGGEVFVQGQDPNVQDIDKNRTYEKYSGGIKINNEKSGIVEFNKNVITRNTLNVQDNTTTTIKGNFYGRNVYLGKIAEGYSGFAEGSKLNINTDGAGKVILDNDLTVKAKDSEINMNDFYGINDKNIDYDDLNPDLSKRSVLKNGKDGNENFPSDVVKSSSSILINGYKGGGSDSKVTITNSAYIMGTAHIATQKNYQTGESGAVKDNYIAYSVPDARDLSETFDYDSPLYLLNEDNVFKKAEHFKNYWTEQGNADTGGIIWPNPDNIFSVGAIVYKAGTQTFVKKPNYTQGLEHTGTTYDDSGEICKRRIDFASEVYKFGQPAEIGEYNKSVLTDFNSLMDFSSISKYIEFGDKEKAIFNPDSDTTIVIQGKYSKGVTVPQGKTEKIIHTDDNGNLSAVIATNGDVVFDGDVKFRGTIICKGTLDIKNNSEVTIDYDPDVISRLRSQNEIEEEFKSVFGGIVVNSDETSTSNKLEEEILNTNYDINRFLETKFWKLKQ